MTHDTSRSIAWPLSFVLVVCFYFVCCNGQTTGVTSLGAQKVTFVHSPFLAYSGSGLYYAFVEGNFDWNNASSWAASSWYKGKYGSLAAVTNQQANDSLVANLTSPSRWAQTDPYQNLFLLGGSDYGYPAGEWNWIYGYQPPKLFSVNTTCKQAACSWYNSSSPLQGEYLAYQLGNNVPWSWTSTTLNPPATYGSQVQLRGFVVQYDTTVTQPSPSPILTTSTTRGGDVKFVGATTGNIVGSTSGSSTGGGYQIPSTNGTLAVNGSANSTSILTFVGGSPDHIYRSLTYSSTYLAFMFKSISEIDVTTHTVQRTASLENAEWIVAGPTPITSTVVVYTFATGLETSGGLPLGMLTLEFAFCTSNISIEYAGDMIDLTELSLKWTAIIMWTFESSNNSLALLIDINKPSDVNTFYEGVNPSSDQAPQATYRFGTTNTSEPGDLLLKLPLKVVLDGNITAEMPVSPGITQNVLTFVFPYFSEQLVYDPSLANLLPQSNPGEGSGNENDNGTSNTTLIIAVSVVVPAVCLIMLLVMLAGVVGCLANRRARRSLRRTIRRNSTQLSSEC